MRIRRRSHTRKAAALLLSLWALFLLSAMIVSWALNINASIALTGYSNRVLEAEAMACSGAEIALHPAVLPGSPLLVGGFAPNRTYETRITGEGGRLNLNWITAGENPARLEILRKYLENRGVDLNERDHMIDCLLDYIDPDNLVRLNGAEDDEQYQVPNRPLVRIDDLKKVRGWEAFTSAPNWDADFTLNSTGPIDLVWASREVLMTLPGMNDAIVDRFVEVRRGQDGIDGTVDDLQFKNVDDVRVALGFSAEQFKQLAGLVGAKDQVLRVVSVGKSADVTRTVQMVIRKTGSIPQLITWKEL